MACVEGAGDGQAGAGLVSFWAVMHCRAGSASVARTRWHRRQRYKTCVCQTSCNLFIGMCVDSAFRVGSSGATALAEQQSLTALPRAPVRNDTHSFVAERTEMWQPPGMASSVATLGAGGSGARWAGRRGTSLVCGARRGDRG